MSLVQFYASRSISSGNALGDLVELEFFPRQQEPSKNTEGSTSISISGRVQNTVFRRDEFWNFKTDRLNEGDEDYYKMLEFCESVDQFEEFQIDVEGKTGNLTGYRPAIFTKNYQRQRVDQDNVWVFSFSVRILPSA